MVGRHKLQALVLSRRNIGEADRLVTLFTREQGLVKAIAKGVRKIPSRRGGHLEPYTMVLTLISATRAGNYVSAVETMRAYQDLQLDKRVLPVVRNIALSVTSFFEEGQVQPTLFDAIAHAWDILPSLDDQRRALLEMAVAIHALELAGVMPDMDRCQVCRTTNPREAVVLDGAAGGFRCLLCQGGFMDTEYSFPGHLLKVIRFIQNSPERVLKLSLSPAAVTHLLLAWRRYMAHVTEQPIFMEPQTYPQGMSLSTIQT